MDLLILLLLCVYPLGQLPKIFLGFHLIDVIVVLVTVFMVVEKFKSSNIPITYRIKEIYKKYKNISLFLFASLFSLLVSFVFGAIDIFGVLYLFRFWVYLTFVLFFPVKKKGKSFVLLSLVIVAVVIALYGWLQYLLFPDLTNLIYFGWDDHYYRLVSTFIDPAFTGILLVLGTLSALAYVAVSKRSFLIGIVVFLMISLAFTYSRASFISLILGYFVFLWKKNKTAFFALIFLFFFFVVLLPSPGGEGVKLGRTSSIQQKIDNYKESLKIISHSPLFGVGYNNICKVKRLIGIDISRQYHSCYGLDNSFLLIWAANGIVGLIGFIVYINSLTKNTTEDIYGRLFNASGLAVFFHSFFTNTIFYTWIIVWLAFLASISRFRESS